MDTWKQNDKQRNGKLFFRFQRIHIVMFVLFSIPFMGNNLFSWN